MLRRVLLISILLFSFLLMQSCIDTENWTGNNLGSNQPQPVVDVVQKDNQKILDKKIENQKLSENTTQNVKD